MLLVKKFKVVGFDINKPRVDELNSGYDRTLELSSESSRINLKWYDLFNFYGRYKRL